MSDLVVEGVSKRYGSVRALDSVSATFHPGEVHAVLGENGAGKSTLVSVLAGFVTPDKGSARYGDTSLPLGRPFACRQAGVAMVHQHFTLVPEFTVGENLALSRMRRLPRRLDVPALSAPALKLAAELGWEVDPKARVANLPVGIQQRIEILKNLADDSPVLILDEPTAVLTAEEFEDLARVLGELKGKGKIVILIAHKLSEVLAVADRVTVLRRGEVVGTATRSEVDAVMLANWMVGSLPEELSSSAEVPSDEGFELVGAWVKGDRGEDAVAGIDLQVRRGEIVGLGGVDGNGQVELAEAVVGVRPLQSGTRRWKGGPVTDELSVAYIPQDRQGDGLALEMSIQDNMLITGVRRRNLARGPFLKGREIAAWARHLVDAFQIKTPNVALPVGSLSGGNQQKVVVSRSLDQTPDLLVCANPTRGLDIRATDFVHRQLVAAKEAGAAVLLISTDLDELAAIATRTLFLSNGKLVAVEGEQSLVGGTP